MEYYEFAAHVDSVYDGDTVEMTLDLGFHLSLQMHRPQRARMLGIQAPELRDEDGVTSRNALAALIEDRDVVVRTYRAKPMGSFSRFLVEIFADDGTNVNQWMIDHHHAVVYTRDLPSQFGWPDWLRRAHDLRHPPPPI